MGTSKTQRPLKKILQAVVKVLTVSDAPDYDQPWQTEGPINAAGSGAIVSTKSGLRVLTNGHVVENQVFVEVRRYGRARKYVASVEGVGHECDLALLTVEDESFFEGIDPIELGGLPSLSDRVSVLGYPIGGDRLSVTEGIASRIEMSPYAQSQRTLLAVQVDAAINSGNSGGPVVMDGKLVGVAFQSLDEAENVGYMIAAPVVRHFLEDMESGTFDGFPDLGVSIQNLESKAHRRSLGLEVHRGVLIVGVAYESSAWKVLQEGDVLLELNGVRVSADGTVRFRKSARIDFSYLVSQRHVGEVFPVTVWRNGSEKKLEVVLKPPKWLVPEDRYDIKPTYFLYGGLLFVPLSRDYLKSWDSDWWTAAPRNFIATYESGMRTAARQEVVVLQKVLADRINQGYHDFESYEVTKVQGKPMRDLRELVRRVETTKESFVQFDLSDGSRIVLDREQAKKRNSAIMKRYGVPKDRSEDL